MKLRIEKKWAKTNTKLQKKKKTKKLSYVVNVTHMKRVNRKLRIEKKWAKTNTKQQK